MKIDLSKLNVVASDAASLANRSFSSAHDTLSRANSAALAAGQYARDVVVGAVDHESTKAVITRAKELSASIAADARKLADKVVDTAKETEVNHQAIADKVETFSMGLGVASGVATAGAAIAAPTGLSAISVALGFTSAPLIVTAAPVIGAVATVTGVVSGGAYFYSKWRVAKSVDDSEEE